MNQQSCWNRWTLVALIVPGVLLVAVGYNLAWALWLPPIAFLGMFLLVVGLGLLLTVPFLLRSWRKQRKSDDAA